MSLFDTASSLKRYRGRLLFLLVVSLASTLFLSINFKSAKPAQMASRRPVLSVRAGSEDLRRGKTFVDRIGVKTTGHATPSEQNTYVYGKPVFVDYKSSSGALSQEAKSRDKLSTITPRVFAKNQDLQTADHEETSRRPLTNDTKPNREAKGFGDVEIFHSYVDFDKFCAPYRLPGKHEPTLILCTYDPEYDYLISKVVHKYHIWDHHLVSGMAYIMPQDDLRRKGHGARISLLDIGCNVGRRGSGSRSWPWTP
ncbi:hypothetical protein BaRGS_00019863 [Batillaria attramentaria]|uniref:Uncharacterized protein n=1 Tax=Batillaria attramentaria TaxID=370345 RepID=A0ABD0KNT6_9CAEN